jgi:predicted nuclease of predicted toxin-antitoxin system
LKLLLDEHYSKEIAERLRALGHDVVFVTERPDMRGRSDLELLECAATERRAIVTENVGDFMSLVHRAAREGKSHCGIVFTSPRSMPRSPESIGLYVGALAALLQAHPADEILADRVHWLTPPERST